MKIASKWAVICLVGLAFVFTGCGGGGDEDVQRTSFISGYIEDFAADNGAASVKAVVVQGITVVLSGPVDRTAMTSSDGSFVFGNLPAGDYRIGFTLTAGQEVIYSGPSGQEFAITLGNNHRVDLINIRVSEGKVTIGNISTVDLGAYNNGETAASAPDASGRWVGTATTSGQPFVLTLSQSSGSIHGSVDIGAAVISGWIEDGGMLILHWDTGYDTWVNSTATIHGNTMVEIVYNRLPRMVDDQPNYDKTVRVYKRSTDENVL